MVILGDVCLFTNRGVAIIYSRLQPAEVSNFEPKMAGQV